MADHWRTSLGRCDSTNYICPTAKEMCLLLSHRSNSCAPQRERQTIAPEYLFWRPATGSGLVASLVQQPPCPFDGFQPFRFERPAGPHKL